MLLAEVSLSAFLFREGSTTYALLDAAKEKSIPKLLESSGGTYASLYVGTEARDLASVAPYLVPLSPDSQLLKTLMSDGWGKAWGVFLQSAAGFEKTRQHLRAQLLTQTPAGHQLYFRYYDPRVLRAFMRVSNGAELRELFGPITHFIVEGEDPKTAIRFSPGANGVAEEKVQLKQPG